MISRKPTLILTVAVLAVVFISIGYAYTAYTVNNGNSTDVAYATVTQVAAYEGDTTPYRFADGTSIEFDTYNEDDADTIYFKVRNPVEIGAGDNTYICEKLGAINLVATITDNVTFPDSMSLKINSSTGFDAVGKWVYVMTDEDSNIVAYKDTSKDTKDWTPVGTGLAFTQKGQSIMLNIYYGYLKTDATKEVGTEKFLDNMTEEQDDRAPKGLEGASIVFIVSNNFTLTYDKNGGTGSNKVLRLSSGTVNLIPFGDTGIAAPEGKSFAGWGSTPDATAYITSIELNGNKTVYAIYQDDPQPNN